MKTQHSTLLITIFAFGLFASPLAAQVGVTWDQQYSGAQRFKFLGVFGNAAVFDKETGLVWERNVSGPDFVVEADEGKFYVECYSYLKSFRMEEFVQELFHQLSPRVRVEHRRYIPFSLPKDSNEETFLDELFGPFLDSHYLEHLLEQAKKSWPVLLRIPDGVEDFFVYIVVPEKVGF